MNFYISYTGAQFLYRFETTWAEHTIRHKKIWSNTLSERKNNKQSPTIVVKVHQTLYDVVSATAYILVSDVYDVSGFTGKRQHMELQLYLIAVQLERKWRDVQYISHPLREADRHTSRPMWINVNKCEYVFRPHFLSNPTKLSLFLQTFSIRAIVAFLDRSKSCFWMLPDVSSKI